MMRKGFTLIELLVVISIIGVLSTLILVNFNAARERSRDARRKSDLGQIQNALRLYYNDYGKYPTNASDGRIRGCGSGGTSNCSWGAPWTAGSNTYMQELPADPKSGWRYRYTRNSLDNFTLRACLENKSDPDAINDSGASWCATRYVFELKQ